MEAETDGRMGETMTDEERKKLCADLHLIANDEIEGESWTGLKCKEAADEIERLQNELRALKRDLTWTRDGLVNVERRGRYD